MKLCMTTAILFFLELQAVEIVERPNGEYFITGRGCGISNPIKYLKNFPPKEKLEDYECSFVQLERGTRPLKCKIVFRLFTFFVSLFSSICLHFLEQKRGKKSHFGRTMHCLPQRLSTVFEFFFE